MPDKYLNPGPDGSVQYNAPDLAKKLKLIDTIYKKLRAEAKTPLERRNLCRDYMTKKIILLRVHAIIMNNILTYPT